MASSGAVLLFSLSTVPPQMTVPSALGIIYVQRLLAIVEKLDHAKVESKGRCLIYHQYNAVSI